MNILVFDSENYDNDIYDIVQSYIGNIKFEKINNESLFFQKYNLGTYKLLIIDVTSEEGEIIFNTITNNNEKQKIIVLSKSVNYDSNLSCEQCAFKFNRKLLLKPVKASELINYIQNYENLGCKYSAHTNDIFEILDDIMQQFVFYKYDSQKNKIKKKNQNTKNIKELITITEILNIHNVAYSIDNEDDINLSK